MAVTNNAVILEDFEGAGPTFTSIGGGQGAALNTDVFIAGTQSGARRSDNTTTHGFFANPGATTDISAAGTHVKFYMWVTHYTVLTAAELRIGSTSTDYETHTLTVSEYPPLGGWWPVWLEVDAGTDTGTPSFTAADEFGVAISIGDVGGNAPNNILDQIHHSTRPVMLWDGSTGAFSDFATTDNSNALGTLIDINGVFFLYANLQIGSSTATTFTDSGVVIIAPEFSHLPTTTTWYGIDIDLQNASTVITWTDSVYGSAEPVGAVRKPDLLVTGTSGSVDLSRNRFDGLRNVSFTSGVTMNDGVIANSGLVDLSTAGSNGADISGTVISGSTVAADASAIRWNVNADPNGELDNTTHVRHPSTAHHAIELGTSSPLSMTFTGLTSSGFNATNAQNDSFFHVLRTTDTVTLNIVGGSGNFSYKSAGATVVVNQNINITLTGLRDNTEIRVYNAGTLTEIAGTENATDGSPNDRFFTFSVAASTDIDIRIFNLNFEPADILGFTSPGSSTSIPISQKTDRVFENP